MGETFFCATCDQETDIDDMVEPEMPGEIDGRFHVLKFKICSQCINPARRTRSFKKIWANYVSKVKRNGEPVS